MNKGWGAPSQKNEVHVNDRQEDEIIQFSLFVAYEINSSLHIKLCAFRTCIMNFKILLSSIVWACLFLPK
jgi:hypothetical protein